ncbi:hypothetical protein [Methylobacter sp.]
MSEKLSIFKELMNASILLALVSSLLYISGASYIESYLTEWGVESSLIASNTQEVLVQGASIWFVGGIYSVITAVLLGIGIFSPLYMVSELSKSPLVRKTSSLIYEVLKPKEREELEPPYFLQLINKWLLQFSMLFAFLLIFLLLFYKLLDFSSSQGKEKAANEYKEFSSNTVSADGLFSRKKLLTINGTEKEGYILANSDSLAVLYLLSSDAKPEQVLVIPLSTINQIKAIKNGTIKNRAG